MHANTIEGFFADPIYGGNRDMVGWKLVGFPGARYDYRDVMAQPEPGLHAAAGGPVGTARLGAARMTRRLPPQGRGGRSGSAGPAPSWRWSWRAPGWRWWPSSAAPGATPPPTSTSAPPPTSCATACATMPSCARARKASPCATTRRSGAADPPLGQLPAGQRRGRVRASTGTARPGASCPTTSASAAHTERYGAGFLPEGNHIQDWPVTYDELEPYYDRFEYVLGISGKAGNIKGRSSPAATRSRARARATTRRRR